LGSGRGVSDSASRKTTNGETVLLGWQSGSNLGVYFSPDHSTFTGLREPLLDFVLGIWKRPDLA
jgi:hypothetical protein